MKYLSLIIIIFSLPGIVLSQNHIGDFTSISPTNQGPTFVIPSTHTFQYIIEQGDAIDIGGTLPGNNDFTGYIPINNSSTNGYLSINSELMPGGVTVLDINLDTTLRKWNTTYSEAIDFSGVGGTSNNCSGTVTPWGSIISCEETTSLDYDNDGYNDLGWAVEIDPVNKIVINKIWAAGNFNHENAVIHSNQRTLYQGADSYPGYMYKFVADTAGDLSSGQLYVYVGPKTGNGTWVQIDNSTQEERNTTLNQSEAVGATEFFGFEDVEIGPDGKIYFAVGYESRVYRFQDSDPLTGLTTSNFETFVGDMSYDITHEDGVTSENWGIGNDNLAFDNDGNLWVLQDGNNNYIWVVGPNHTQSNPDVRIFGSAPYGSEPTGITFTPDYKYLMMSIQHPSSGNSSTGQYDAFGNIRYFNKSVSLVVALNEDLGPDCIASGTPCDDNDINTINDKENGFCDCVGIPVNTIFSSCYSVTNGNDDAEEKEDGSSVDLINSDIELVNDGTRGNQVVGLRFNNIQIPKGAIVTEAYIQFTADEVDSEPTELIISAQNVGDAEPFENTINNISSRLRTPQLLDVSWSPEAWESIWEAGIDQRTPDLKHLVQHIIERPDYFEGNSIAMIIEGTGSRTAESYNGNISKSPNLCVSYKVCHTDLVLNNNYGPLSGSFEAKNSITLTGPFDVSEMSILSLKAPVIKIQNEVNLFQSDVLISSDGCEN